MRRPLSSVGRLLEKDTMTQRFQFNRKNGESVEVQGMRVDMGGDLVTVVDTDGQPLMSFADADLSSWFRVPDAQ